MMLLSTPQSHYVPLLYLLNACLGRQVGLVVKVLGSCHNVPGSIPSLGVRSNGISYIQIGISTTALDHFVYHVWAA